MTSPLPGPYLYLVPHCPEERRGEQKLHPSTTSTPHASENTKATQKLSWQLAACSGQEALGTVRWFPPMADSAVRLFNGTRLPVLSASTQLGTGLAKGKSKGNSP